MTKLEKYLHQRYKNCNRDKNFFFRIEKKIENQELTDNPIGFLLIVTNAIKDTVSVLY